MIVVIEVDGMIHIFSEDFLSAVRAKSRRSRLRDGGVVVIFIGT